MLRHRLLFHNHSQHHQRHPLLTNNIISNHSSASWCCSTLVTSCAGLVTPSSQLLASKSIQPHKIIGFKQGRKNVACVESVKNWTWHPFCKQFTDLVHSPSLALPKVRKMEPEMQVFAELNIDENVLRNPPRDANTGRYLPIIEHCNIEQVMKRKGYALSKATPLYRVEQRARILDHNTWMVGELSAALIDQQNKHLRNEGQIDIGAERFVMLCGFDDRRQFRIVSGGQDFRIFGKTCHSKPDCYMVKCLVNNNLLLILKGTDKEDDKATPSHTNLGQVVGEMLMMLSASHKDKQFRNVLGVRYSNSRVCGFRLDSPSERQLDTLIETRNVPHKNLQLLCTHQDPGNCRGWSLVDKGGRRQALQMMADIRAFMLKK